MIDDIITKSIRNRDAKIMELAQFWIDRGYAPEELVIEFHGRPVYERLSTGKLKVTEYVRVRPLDTVELAWYAFKAGNITTA